MERKLWRDAISPKQYDKLDGWGDDRRGHEAFFWRQLQPFADLWSGKDVLEVGAGTGWMLDRMDDSANSVLGLESSKEQFVRYFSDRPTHGGMFLCDWRNYRTTHKHDLVVAHMVLSHVPSLPEFFAWSRERLKNTGACLITVPDPEYFTSETRGKLEFERCEEGRVVKRPGGTADVIREIEAYRLAGARIGFNLIAERLVVPDEEYIQLAPRYRAMEGRPIAHTLHFAH